MKPSRPSIPRLIAAGLLFLALAKHSYGYYVFLRWIVCAVAAWTALQLHSSKSRLRWLTWPFAAAAVLFNPLVPVHLDRGSWAYLDVALGAAFLATDLALQIRTEAASAAMSDVR